MDTEMVVHNGGCHCRKVRWEVQAPDSVVAWRCNCSDCWMRGNIHFIVPAERFKLLGDSKEFLTTYTFGTHTAKHTFCKICGITSFYVPRSNPDGIAVTFKCVDRGTLAHVEIKQFDGSDWEGSYNQTGIASFSKAACGVYFHENLCYQQQQQHYLIVLQASAYGGVWGIGYTQPFSCVRNTRWLFPNDS